MSTLPTQRTTIIAHFDVFRADLDDYNDRRERLIKNSRDLTNISKRSIFLLHRVILESSAGVPVDDLVLRKSAADAGRQKLLGEARPLLAAIGADIQGDAKFWRYHRQISPGIQEYIEALSFAHYLEHNTLITYDEVKQSLVNEDGLAHFPLALSDYLLGISDLTGELMRFAISTISRRGGRANATAICTFVRNCRADLERLTPYVPDLVKKQSVTTQSLEKIENAAYAIMVRSSEYDLSQEMLDDIVAQTMSDYQND